MKIKTKLATLAFLITGSLNSSQGFDLLIKRVISAKHTYEIHQLTLGEVTVNGMKLRPVERGERINGSCFYGTVGISRQDIYNRVLDFLDGKDELPPYERARLINCVCQICDMLKFSLEEDLRDFNPTFDITRAAESVASTIYTRIAYSAQKDCLRFAQFIREIPEGISIPHELQEIPDEIQKFEKDFQQKYNETIALAKKTYGGTPLAETLTKDAAATLLRFIERMDQWISGGTYGSKALSLICEFYSFITDQISGDIASQMNSIENSRETQEALESAYDALQTIQTNLRDMSQKLFAIDNHIRECRLEDLFVQFDPKLTDNTIRLLSELGYSIEQLPVEKIYTNIQPCYLPLVKNILREKIIGHPIQRLDNKSKFVYNVVSVALPLLSPILPEKLQDAAMTFGDYFYPGASGHMPTLISIAFDIMIVILNQDNPANPVVFEAHRFSRGDTSRDVIYIQQVPYHYRYLEPISK